MGIIGSFKRGYQQGKDSSKVNKRQPPPSYDKATVDKIVATLLGSGRCSFVLLKGPNWTSTGGTLDRTRPITTGTGTDSRYKYFIQTEVGSEAIVGFMSEQLEAMFS